MKYAPTILLLVLAIGLSALVKVKSSDLVKCEQKYDQKEADFQELGNSLVDCADKLATCEDNQHTLAVACMDACKGCPDVCERD